MSKTDTERAESTSRSTRTVFQPQVLSGTKASRDSSGVLEFNCQDGLSSMNFLDQICVIKLYLQCPMVRSSSELLHIQ